MIMITGLVKDAKVGIMINVYLILKNQKVMIYLIMNITVVKEN